MIDAAVSYSEPLAEVYDAWWAPYAKTFAPRLRAFFESERPEAERTVLDLCCGTGLVLEYLVRHGYRGVGVDLAPAMLRRAAARLDPQLREGIVSLVEADAMTYRSIEPFSLVTSTTDALSHLPTTEALRACLRNARENLRDDGILIFDLLSRRGLMELNGMSVEDKGDEVILARGMCFPEDDRAFQQITVFRREAGKTQFERFDYRVAKLQLAIQAVIELLREVGFSRAYAAPIQNLGEPLSDPESVSRPFLVAYR